MAWDAVAFRQQETPGNVHERAGQIRSSIWWILRRRSRGSGSVTVNVDPEAFKIIDGKLYLIYDAGNAAAFADNANDLVPKADANWPVVEAKLAVDQPDWNLINNP